MYSFCPHCGQSIEQDQAVGKMLVCRYCKKEIGMILAAPVKVMIDQTQELLARGTAGRCPVCQHVVELKKGHCVPHYQAGQKRICQGSGKEAAAATPAASPQPVAPPRIMSTGKDLSKYTTRAVLRVVSCRQGQTPRIEELTLDYLDKSDRVRIQIEALRDILGSDFRMKPYPAQFNRPHLALWSGAGMCVAGRKHEKGGLADLDAGDLAGVVDDFKSHPAAFFA